MFLAYLRVYKFPESEKVTINLNIQDKAGRFASLPNCLNTYNATPVLSDRIFAQRKHQIETLQPPLHPELEELQGALASLAITNSVAKQLEEDIKVFLGWSHKPSTLKLDPDLAWIERIAEVGNSSNGHAFEKLVRRSLIKLGFKNTNSKPEASLDYEATGGAGGLDFYCDFPYQLVGECKATQSEKVPDGTAAQLIKLGYKHLQEKFDNCVKLIVAAGELTKDALKTCIGNKINVITPETLQSLVEFQSRYSIPIDLLKLKECLQNSYGLADTKIQQYIADIRKNLEVRSHIVESVKQLGEAKQKGRETVEIRVQYNAVFVKEQILQLDDESVHELLIELSSPLTGYLGRIKGTDWRSDRFYFLRDLPVTNIS
ncbi:MULTISPECIES: DUF1802 domain-containing protein [Fischerella]|uniref:DUF1802 domain-containing protein n=1 Tax=Fischerella TaxID=1190 RepID=UPI001F3624A8|nr:DUF1802 domain-containing protein [Fischerella muscicola]